MGEELARRRSVLWLTLETPLHQVLELCRERAVQLVWRIVVESEQVAGRVYRPGREDTGGKNLLLGTGAGSVHT
jgi:hypothetical protein